MHFLFCSEFYYPSVGGVQEVMRQIAEHMVARGHQVTVATTRLEGVELNEWNGVKIERFAISGNMTNGIVGEVKRYRDFIVTFPADAILIKAAQQWTFDALFPVLDKIKARKVFIPCGFSGLYEPHYKNYFQELPGILAKFDELIFYANQYRDIDFCRSHGLKNLNFVANGASESEFAMAEPVPGFRKRLGIPEDSFVFATVGGMTGVKGHREIAEAFDRMEMDGRHVTLILNGNRGHICKIKAKKLNELKNKFCCFWRNGMNVLKRDGLKLTIKRFLKMILIGLRIMQPTCAHLISLDEIAKRASSKPNKKVLIIDLPRPEVVDLFKSIDLFVFASNIEYSPLVLFESAAAGTPFLTVPVGNSEEIAAMTGAGIICDAPKDVRGYTRADPDVLAVAMRDAMRDPARLKQLGETGRKNWLEKFTWEHIARHYEQLLTGRGPVVSASDDLANVLISIVMPVYNGEAYVRAAIDSMLAQSHAHFEFIIIDDGSTDKTVQIIEDIKDPRIKLLRQQHAGLSAALNLGIAQAQGKYIARMDHDDLALPSRLEKQVLFLETHPDYALVGTQSKIWSENCPTDRGHQHATDNATLQWDMLLNNYIVHSSVMMRRDLVVSMGGYTTDPKRSPPEDYELWSRMMRKYKIANLVEPLMIYREVPTSICRTVSFEQALVHICSENIAYAAGLDGPDINTQDITALIHRVPALLSSHPDYGAMARIITKAAVSIDGTSPGSNAVLRAADLVRRLRWQPVLFYYDRMPSGVRALLQKTRQIILRIFPEIRTVKCKVIEIMHKTPKESGKA